MRNLQDYAVECMEMLDDLDVPYGNVVSWDVNTRAKRRWGQTRRIATDTFTINISSLLLDETTAEEGLMNTIIHELLHTCPGCFNHGAQWKAYAARVHKAYGYDVKRTSTADEKGVENYEQKVASTRKGVEYRMRCDKCGVTITRYKMSKFVKNPERYSHNGCSGHFKRIDLCVA